MTSLSEKQAMGALEPAVVPTEVSGSDVVREIGLFRAEVWRRTGCAAADAFGDAGWIDPVDAGCRHWVIRNPAGRLLAAGRLSVHGSLAEVHQAAEYVRYGVAANGPIAAPDRVVVDPAAQGMGLGGLILRAQDDAATAAGARRAVRQASPGMVRLLARCGWRVLGPASPDGRFPGVVFSVAVKDLSRAA